MRLRRGDPTALETLLKRHWDGVVTFVARILFDEDRAEDVAQQAFVNLWDARHRLEPTGRLDTLLFRIARNKALDELKSGGRSAQFVDITEHEPRSPSSPSADLEVIELHGRFDRAIRAMPVSRREVFLLMRHTSLSHRHIADLLDVSPQTVANHMSLALKDLRRALGPHANPE